MTLAFTVFQGPAGDHNNLAIPGALSMMKMLSQRFGASYVVIGTPEPAAPADWNTELAKAMPGFRAIRHRFDAVLAQGQRSVAATSRCAVSIATLPAIAHARRDACVVWFDSHADLNTPETSASGYLGGLALSAPAGLWESGLGAGLTLDNIVLVGQRDLDPFELELIHTNRVRHIRPGADLPLELADAIALRPVYVHLDCDVLNPGIVPTDYVHEDGLTLETLRRACEAIAQSEVIGIEIAEFQNAWSEDGDPVSPAALLDALHPLFARMRQEEVASGFGTPSSRRWP